MKICYIGNLDSIHAQRWAEVFVKRGHQVSFVSHTRTSNSVPNMELHFIKAFRTGSYLLNMILGILFLPQKIFALRNLLNKIKPDVVHVHYINEFALFALLTGFKPIVITAWGSDVLIPPEKSKIRKMSLRYILRNAGHITCDAVHMQEKMISLGAHPDKISVINFGADVEKYHPRQYDSNLKEKLKAKENDKIVISMRNHHEVYNIECLINAIPHVLEKIPTTLFVIGGSGPLTEKYKRMASDLNIGKNINFIGRVSQEELPSYLATSDVYISTSLSDAGLASSTGEAMAAETAVIITDVVDNGKWIQNDVNGLLFCPQDAKDLASKVILLLENKAKMELLSKAGRETIVKRYNLYVEMEKVEKLYIKSLLTNERVHP